MKKETTLLLLLLLTKLFLPFLLSHPSFELHRDEFLYYQQGQHPALGYLENPPLIGWLAYISSLLGGSIFWIKFWPAFFGAATLLVTLKMTKALGGNIYAQAIAGLGVLFSAYLRIHFLFQPNFLDIFFWTLSAYFTVCFINTGRSRYIFLLAVSLAAGWYSKYSVLFFITALLFSFLLTPHRRIFLQRQFWMAFLAGFLLVVPNLLWQYFHNWPLAHHMEELQETQLQHLNRADFLKEQLLMLFPVGFVWLGGLRWCLQHIRYRLLGYCYLLVVLLLMMGSGKGYYALGVYPMLLSAGGVWAERISFRRRWLKIGMPVLILLLSLPFVPLLLPLQSPEDMAITNEEFGVAKMGLLRWEDGRDHPLQQDFADMIGWKELTQKAEAFYQSQPDSVKRETMVYCANYGLAGGLKFYAKDDEFRGRVISENGSFLLWISNRLYFKHLLYIDDEIPEADDSVLSRFADVQVIDSCANPLSRQYGTHITFYRKGSDSARIIAAQDIRRKQAEFSR